MHREQSGLSVRMFLNEIGRGEIPRVRVNLVGPAVDSTSPELVTEEVKDGTSMGTSSSSHGEDSSGIKVGLEVEDLEQLVRRAFEKVVGSSSFSSSLSSSSSSRDVSFFDVGGDVVNVHEVIEVMRDRGLEVPMATFLRAPTVGVMARYLYEKQRGVGGEEKVVEAEVRRTVGRQMDMDEEWDVGVGPRNSGQALAEDAQERRGDGDGGVLVTGATGLVGSQVLLCLLARGRRVTALVRRTRRDSSGGSERALDALVRRLKERKLVDASGVGVIEDAAQRKGLECVYGDLGSLNLGMESAEEFQRVADECRVIVSAAAQVSHVLPYGSLRACNVVGIRELLRLACSPWSSGAMSIVHVGMDSPMSRELSFAEEDLWRIGCGHSQSRYVAERILERARERGIRIVSHRVENLGPSVSAGRVASKRDMKVSILAACVHLGALPSDWVMRWSPADECVSRIVDAVDNALCSGGVSGSDPSCNAPIPTVCATADIIREALLKAASLDLKLLPTGEWLERLRLLRSRVKPDKRLYAHVAGILAAVAAIGVDCVLDAGVVTREADVAFEHNDTHLALIRITVDAAQHDISLDGGIHGIKAMDPTRSAEPTPLREEPTVSATFTVAPHSEDAERADDGVDVAHSEHAEGPTAAAAAAASAAAAADESRREELETLRSANVSLEAKASQLENQLEVALNAIRSLGVVNAGLEGDVGAARSQAQSLADENKRLETLRGDLEAEMRGLQAQVNESNMSLGGLAVREQTLKEEMRDLTNRFRDLEASRDAVEASQLSTDAKNEFLREQLETFRLQVASEKRAKEHLAEVNDGLMSKFEPAIASAEAEIERLRRKLAESDARFEVAEKEAAAKEAAHRVATEALAAELDALKLAKGAVEAELEGARTNLAAAEVESAASKSELEERAKSDAQLEEEWHTLRVEREEFDAARAEFVFVKRSLEHDVAELRHALESEESELWKEIERLRGALASATSSNAATSASKGMSAALATPMTRGSLGQSPGVDFDSPAESILYRPTFHAREYAQ